MSLLTNILNSLFVQTAQSAQLSTLVPATILVLCNLVFMFPALDITIEDAIQIGLVVSVTITISSLLWALNGPLTELLEGATFEETRLGRCMIKRQSNQLKRLEEDLSKCQIHLEYANNWLNNILPLHYWGNPSALQNDPEYRRILRLKVRWQAIQSHYLEERLTDFPPDSEHLLPTRLGNTLAAARDYPHLRYGIYSPVVWPRLTHILDKNGFTAYVEREKSTFDFLLNLTVITAILGLECLGFAARFIQPIWLVGTVIAVIIVIITYPMLLANAAYLGDMIKVAFDLYRHDLRKALLCRQPDSLDDEKHLWENISNFLAVGQSPPSTTWDYSLSEEEPDRPETGKEVPGKEAENA